MLSIPFLLPIISNLPFLGIEHIPSSRYPHRNLPFSRCGDHKSGHSAASLFSCWRRHAGDPHDSHSTFTDGVGHCSQTLANRCSSTLGHNWRQVPASAVQVRIGGTKGVLSVVPDTMIGESSVGLRNSMVKFKSHNRTLNVLKVCLLPPKLISHPIWLTGCVLRHCLSKSPSDHPARSTGCTFKCPTPNLQ